ncbi:MAG: DNA-binding protein WhiA, partial [Coriobacteriales bacterium]|nr:DNA-binding protein WhiA [Coriobacteriales bacterium]
IVNAEIANQKKSSIACAQQLQNIKFIIDNYEKDKIPQSLLQVALLRIEHPDATLKELGEYANPKLSKNAVYHRFLRIEEMVKAKENHE